MAEHKPGKEKGVMRKTLIIVGGKEFLPLRSEKKMDLKYSNI